MKRLLPLLLLVSCGYRPVHSADAERFSVVLSTSSIPDAALADDVVAGVRDQLARANALAPGSAYPRCEVEVMRADETSDGIAAVPNAGGQLLPEARATHVGVVARAWIVRTKDGDHVRDTGDVRAMEIVSVAPDAQQATFRQVDSLRAAARRVGDRIGTRILGGVTSSD